MKTTRQLLRGLAAALAFTLLAACSDSGTGERVLVARPEGGDFVLQSAAGPLDTKALRGNVLLVYFGYVHCPDICPMTLGQLQAVVSSPDIAANQARVVMISVDGDRDTPAVLKRYLAPVSPDFIGLTGNPRKVRDIAAQFSAVFFQGMPADAAGNYLVEHTSQVYLLDKQGRLHSTFFNAPADVIAAATRQVGLAKP